jgi:regulator of sigma E protease
MVFVHELGHFLAAKRVGIAVETFSLGWGKKIVGFDYKGTNYRISMIPVGGYCKMRGEDPFRPQEQREDGSFYAAAPWKRIAVAAAGPVANVVFAVLVLTAIWWIGFKTYTDGNRIVLASDYTLDRFTEPPPATAAGLQTGDRIVAIDGQPVRDFQQIVEMVSTSPDQKLVLTVLRGDRRLSVSLVPTLNRQTGAGQIGIYAWRDPVVWEVKPDSPAAEAGLSPGDVLVSAGGQPVRNTIDLYQQLQSRPAVIALGFLRGGQQMSTEMHLTYSEQGTADLGLTFKPEIVHSPPLGPIGAVQRGAVETWDTFLLAIKGIGLLFRGVNLHNAVVGPLRLTYYVGAVATSGFSLSVGQGLLAYFRFLALISVVLFLMNLLPIPGLDGGQILVFVLEVARRRPLNPKIVSYIQMVSFAFIILLVVVVTFSDVLFFAGR